jgi:hypothetical protein
MSGLTLLGALVSALDHRQQIRPRADRDPRPGIASDVPGLSHHLSSWRSGRWRGISGIAGALYVPQVGIINPSARHPANSIEVAIWAAVGGRGTLFGPLLGAFAVSGAKTWFTVAYPELWLYFLGLLFVVVTLLLPRGLMGLADTLRGRSAGAATRSAALETGAQEAGS